MKYQNIGYTRLILEKGWFGPKEGEVKAEMMYYLEDMTRLKELSSLGLLKSKMINLIG